MHRTFIAFDIETYVPPSPRTGEFLFGGCWDGDNYIWFNSRNKMKKFLTCADFANVIFIAHNLEYDLNRIFLMDERLERYYVGSRLCFAKYPIPNGRNRKGEQKYTYIYFWDSFGFCYCALSEVGEIIGVAKKEIEFSNSITAEYLEYNEFDCRVVYDFVTGLQKQMNSMGGNIRTTIAGCGIDLFRRNYMPPESEYWQLPLDIIEDFRLAYFGGRTEVFNLSEHKGVNYYDINSSYPNSMLGDLPCLDTWINKVNLEYEGCTLADIETPKDMYYPVLPFRGEKVLFPVGNWRGYYFNNELRYAESRGISVKPVRGIHYTHSLPVFKEFVDAMYSLRLKCETKFESFIYKTLMNSVYGRFAMRAGLEKHVGGEREIISTVPVSTNVIWSGMIAASSRIALHKLLIKSDSIYCDTDSTMTKKKLRGTSKKLGGFSLEKRFKRFRAFQPKDYEYEDTDGNVKRKIKGVPSRAIQTGENSFQYDVPIKYKSSIRRNIPIHSWIKVDKHLSNVYDKRVVLKGGDTRPHVIEPGIRHDVAITRIDRKRKAG